MAENQIRQGDNRIFIEGILSEMNLELKTIKSDNKEKEAITGSVIIKTSEIEEHEVHVFAYKLKKDGKENAVFKGLKTVMETYKPMATVGFEEADRVRVSGGQLTLNEYVGQDGEVKNYPKIMTSFINRLKATDEFNPRAEFELDIYVQAVLPEIKNEEETGRAIIKAYFVEYGGKIKPFSFIVQNENAVSYVEQNYLTGSSVNIQGDIINKVDKQLITKETAFGEGKPREVTHTTREYVITSGSEVFEEGNVKYYNPQDITKALTERELEIEKMKNSPKEQSAPSASKPTGFSTPSTTAPISNPTNQANKYDIPF